MGIAIKLSGKNGSALRDAIILRTHMGIVQGPALDACTPRLFRLAALHTKQTISTSAWVAFNFLAFCFVGWVNIFILARRS